MKRKIVGFQSLDEGLTKFSRMMRVVLLVIFAVVAATAGTYAQNKTLSGTVTDATKQGLPGVTVAVKGTTVGTITDIDGKFSLSVPASARTLTFSFVGMTTQEVAIGTQTTFSITLKEESKALEEVVVIGFGSQKKESVVGSIVTATQESLKRSGSPANLTQALTGQLAGVTTISSTGEPGDDDPRILIRAQGTWNNSQPLILVDGVERKMNDIDISEVEAISVLKDASATSVFGVKGSEGVILITTKRGQIGKPRLTVDANFTMKEVSKPLQKVDAYTGITLANKAIEQQLPTYESDWGKITPMSIANMYRNRPGYDRNALIPDANGGVTPFHYYEVFPDIDWVKENIKPFAYSNRVNMNVSGGTNFAQYFGSFSYQHDGDIMRSGLKTTRPYRSQWAYDRFNFRTNLDFNITKTTKFSVNLSGYVGTKFESFSVNNDSGFWNGLYNLGPNAMYPLFSDGYFGYNKTWTQIGNPVAAINGSGIEKLVRTQIASDFKLKQNLDFITKGLSLSGSVSYDTRFNTSAGIGEFWNGGGGFSRWIDPNIIFMKPGENWNQYVFGSNVASGKVYFDYVEQPATIMYESSAGLGGQYNGNDYWGNAMERSAIHLYYQAQLDYARKFGKHDVALTAVVDREESTSGSEFPRRREDWIGRFTYNYDGRYFLEGNGAYNGSERFAPKYRFGFFPSVGAKWMISNEKWMKRDWLDKLALRYNIGLVGNDVSGSRWAYTTVWAQGDATRFGSASVSTSPFTGYYEQAIANPDLHWETSQKSNYALEAALFRNLINLEIQYYTDDRHDLYIGNQTVAHWFGYAIPGANLGKTHTQGYEIEAKFQKTLGKVHVWLNTAFTHAKDEILYMQDAKLLPAYQKAAGFQIGQTKSNITAGFLNNWDDVYGMTAYSSNKASYLPGDIRTVDFNADGIIDTYDSAPYAYPTRPQNTYNYSLGADYKGWSIYLQFYGVNNVSRTMSLSGPFSDGGTNTKVYTNTTNQWSPDNLDATWKAMRINNTTTDGTLYLMDASYFRLKTAEIAYQFEDKAFLKKLGLSSLRMYLNGNNLFLWSKMWNDREDNSAADQNAYPLIKRYNLGLTVNF